MVLITIVTGAYKPTYNWGAPPCRESRGFKPNHGYIELKMESNGVEWIRMDQWIGLRENRPEITAFASFLEGFPASLFLSSNSVSAAIFNQWYTIIVASDGGL